MKKIKRIFCAICVLIGLCCQVAADAGIEGSGVSVPQVARISNGRVTLSFNPLHGRYSLINGMSGEVLVDSSEIRFDQRAFSDADRICSIETKSLGDEKLGAGKQLVITSAKANDSELVVRFTLYEDYDFVDISMGMKNLTLETVRLKRIEVINGHLKIPATSFENFRLLGGGGGGDPTTVTRKNELASRNNLLATWGSGDDWNSLVAGGLTYHDYEKFVEVTKGNRSARDAYLNDGKELSSHPAGKVSDSGLRLKLYAKDTVGRGIKPGETYICPDRFYVDLTGKEPFATAERYGRALRMAQDVKLSMYTFPSVCLWFLNYSNYGGDTGDNDTSGAVAEMDKVIKTGFLNTAPVAIRLVPDNYEYNNQQGWWDDAHFSKYGSNFHTPTKGAHYVEPYETSEKWGQAIRKRGGIPLTYFQTNWRSEDYAVKFPGHMLFNHSWARKLKPAQRGEVTDADRFSPTPPARHKEAHPPCQRRNRKFYGHDFTDPDFLAHMRQVFADFRKGGMGGLMYDYPWSGWPDEGGMEDDMSTAAAAYRNIFELPYKGLGPQCWIHERNLERGSDIALGLVASQRMMWDTDKLTPASVSKGGLRWYKNRVVVNYDADGKKIQTGDLDADRRVLTMSYVTTGRLLLGQSFGIFSKETLDDLERIYPFHIEPKSARPIDAFIREIPTIYDFQVNDDWDQVTLYNPSDTDDKNFEVPLSGIQTNGALGLDPAREYHAYDFWNDHYVGRLKGNGVLKQTLRKNEARMISLHAVTVHPQFVSTDRHIMQGYVDLVKKPIWDKGQKLLSATSRVVAGRPYRVTIALNGHQPLKATADGLPAELRIRNDPSGLADLFLKSDENREIKWKLQFE
jgi:hypothetical protein